MGTTTDTASGEKATVDQGAEIADLIAKLEAATGPDRALDLAIWLFVGGNERREAIEQQGWIIRAGDEVVPVFTGSIDAALTLVPDGAWDGCIMWNFGELQRGGYVELNLANPLWDDPDCPVEELNRHAACVADYDNREAGVDRTPRPLALAICIAALKARLEGRHTQPSITSRESESLSELST